MITGTDSEPGSGNYLSFQTVVNYRNDEFPILKRDKVCLMDLPHHNNLNKTIRLCYKVG